MARGIEKLHPDLIPICEEFARRCEAAGLNVLITETFRTKAEQDAIYAQGRTKPGAIISNAPYPKSPHCWGVAFDFCRNVKGREYDDSDGFFKRCGVIGESLGLTWGGRWTGFPDKPHLEFARFMPNSSTLQLRQKYGTPEKFLTTWKEDEELTQEQFDKMFEASMAKHEQARAAKPVSTWAKAAWARLTSGGIVDGKRPQAYVTREEVVTMMDRNK